MIAAKWKLWIVILITSLLRVDGAAKLVLLTISRSNSKKKDRKEGQKLIQGAMIRKDGRRKTKREVDSPLADFSCPITLSRVSYSFGFRLSQTLLRGVHFIWPFCNHYMSWSSALQRTLFADQSTKMKDKKSLLSKIYMEKHWL